MKNMPDIIDSTSCDLRYTINDSMDTINNSNFLI